MKLIKRLFVGSIILLLIATPTLVIAAGVNKNTKPSSLNVSEYNSLGTAELKHQPLLRTILTDKGLITHYYPPEGNPLYDYYFPEDENGYVNLNFTLYVKHLKNPIPTYWVPYRFSGITLWINAIGEDYCYSRTLTECTSATFVYYNISINSTTPLFTNNSTMPGIFWCSAFLVPSFTMNPPPKWVDFCEKNFC